MNTLAESLNVKIETWQVMSLDVWSELDDDNDCSAHWVKNNFFNVCKIELPECGISNDEIIQELIDADVLVDDAHDRVMVLDFGCESYIEIVRKGDLYPLLDLRLINE